MKHLFAPWRHDWVSGAAAGTGEGERPAGECLFCAVWKAPDRDAENLVVHRSGLLVMLNRFPYNGGHTLIAPPEHAADLEGLSPVSRAALIEAAARCCAAMRDAWNPHGFNIGINLGEEAGAGIPGHVHFHVVPRWRGDTNFMTAAGETRVVSTDLARTHSELRRAFAAREGGGH